VAGNLTVGHWGDESVAPFGDRLDEPWCVRLVAEDSPDLEDMSSENFGLDIGGWPDCLEQFVVSHETACMLDEMGEHSERFGHDKHTRLPSPNALI
jgi:hypothetical protein